MVANHFAVAGTVMRVSQSTLESPVSLSGVGLHSGAAGRVTLHPAVAGAGIVFQILGENGERQGALIAANVGAVSETRLGTCLSGSGGRSVRTVEHLLAAIAISSIDNICIEIEGPEIPAMDGSAGPFLDAIDRAGTKKLPAPRAALKVTAPIEVRDGERFIRATPDHRRRLDVSIAFADAAIGGGSISVDLDKPEILRRVARARTFCRLADIDAMRKAGLGQGGSLDNAVVVDGGRILNAGGLRDPDEFVLHKALDMVGDLALAGAPIIGRIEAMKPGHDLNVCFLRVLAAQTSAIERIALEAFAVPAEC